MSRPPCRPSIPRAVRFIALAATLTLTALGLSQCRMVTDTVTGLTVAPGRLSGRSTCAKNCNESFEVALREENRRHLAALRECGQDAQCRSEENKRHEAAVDQLQDARRQCKKNCYNEGGGGGR